MPSTLRGPVAIPRRAHALDLLNVLLADVRDGLGPYLSIYLLLAHHWDQRSIGFVMAVGGIGAIVAQAPAGALVNRTTAKRAVIIGYNAAFMTLGALAGAGFMLYLIAMPETAPTDAAPAVRSEQASGGTERPT